MILKVILLATNLSFFLFYVIVPNGIAAILGILFSALFLKKVFMVCILVEVMSLMLTCIGIYFINKKGVKSTKRGTFK